MHICGTIDGVAVHLKLKHLTSKPIGVAATENRRMSIANSLASLGLRRRLPYLSNLYARIDAARAETEAARAETEAARADLARCVAIQKRFMLMNHLNLTLLLDRTSPVDDCIIQGKGWESEQIRRLFSFIKAFSDFRGKRYFLDVGAYWGLYSLIAHQNRWFDRIVAFEPDPLNRSQLHAQLALNLLVNEIEVRSVALSDRTSSKPFLKSESHSTGN